MYIYDSLARRSVFDEKGILAELPARLANQIHVHVKAELMGKIPIFKYIDNKMVALHIFKQMASVFYEEGQVIIRQGDQPSDMYFIVTGRARVYKEHTVRVVKPAPVVMVEPLNLSSKSFFRRSESVSSIKVPHRLSHLSQGLSRMFGTEIITARDQKPTTVVQEASLKHIMKRTALGDLSPGEFCGLSALLDHHKHTATVEATSVCQVYVLRNQELLQILREQPAVALSLQLALGKAASEQQKSLGRRHARVKRGEFVRDLRKQYALTDRARGPRVRGVSHVIAVMRRKTTTSISPVTPTALAPSRESSDKSNASSTRSHAHWSKVRKSVVKQSDEKRGVDDAKTALSLLAPEETKELAVDVGEENESSYSPDLLATSRPPSFGVRARSFISGSSNSLYRSSASDNTGGFTARSKSGASGTGGLKYLDRVLSRYTTAYDSDEDSNQGPAVAAIIRRKPSHAHTFSLPPSESFSQAKSRLRKLVTNHRASAQRLVALSEGAVSADDEGPTPVPHIDRIALTRQLSAHIPSTPALDDSNTPGHARSIKTMRRQSFPSLDTINWKLHIRDEVFI